MSAGFSADLARRALLAGTASVAIITPYADQARFIQSLLKEGRTPPDHLECSTIHRFQGREKDLVIFDTVDAAPLSPGVLLSEGGPTSSGRKLINVAISRARSRLIIIADVDFFVRKAPDGVMTRVLSKRSINSIFRKI